MSAGVVTPSITDSWNDGKKLHVVGTLAFTNDYETGGLVADFAAAGVRAFESPKFMLIPTFLGFNFQFVPVNNSTDGKVKIFGTAGDVAASGTLTSDATAPSDGDTVTIGSTVYTFKTALSTGPTVAFEVLIGASAAASLDNLKSAINLTAGIGTTYSTGTTIHPTVSATTNTDTTQLVVAKTSGTGGNSIATTEASSHLSWGASTLASGADATGTWTEATDAAALPTSLTQASVPFYGIWDPFV